MLMIIRRVQYFSLIVLTFFSCKQSEESLFNAAIAFDKNGKQRNAIEIYSQILKRNPKNEMALYNRALCWYVLDSNQKALSDLNHLINTKTNIELEIRTNTLWDKSNNRWTVFTKEAVFQRAVILYNIDSFNKAYKDFKFCADMGYERAESYLYLGSIMVIYRKKEKACEYYHLALSAGNAKAIEFVKGCSD